MKCKKKQTKIEDISLYKMVIFLIDMLVFGGGNYRTLKSFKQSFVAPHLPQVHRPQAAQGKHPETSPKHIPGCQ